MTFCYILYSLEVFCLDDFHTRIFTLLIFSIKYECNKLTTLPPCFIKTIITKGERICLKIIKWLKYSYGMLLRPILRIKTFALAKNKVRGNRLLNLTTKLCLK